MLVVTLKTTNGKIKPWPSDWFQFSVKQKDQENLKQQIMPKLTSSDKEKATIAC